MFQCLHHLIPLWWFEQLEMLSAYILNCWHPFITFLTAPCDKWQLSVRWSKNSALDCFVVTNDCAWLVRNTPGKLVVSVEHSLSWKHSSVVGMSSQDTSTSMLEADASPIGWRCLRYTWVLNEKNVLNLWLQPSMPQTRLKFLSAPCTKRIWLTCSGRLGLRYPHKEWHFYPRMFQQVFICIVSVNPLVCEYNMPCIFLVYPSIHPSLVCLFSFLLQDWSRSYCCYIAETCHQDEVCRITVQQTRMAKQCEYLDGWMWKRGLKWHL